MYGQTETSPGVTMTTTEDPVERRVTTIGRAFPHATLDEDHWNHTGYLGTMDEEGYFKIVGRLKDMVIRGGENIYPHEIEEYLHHHEKISDVYVVGVPDVKYGEELCA